MRKDDYQKLLTILKAETRELPRWFDLERILVRLRATDPREINSYVPECLEQALKDMDSATAAYCQKLVIIQCAVDNWDMLFGGRHTEAIVEQYNKTFARFLTVCSTATGWSQDNIDVYWKDLAMVRGIAFPAGAQIVEQRSGYGIKQGLRGKPIDVLRFLSLTLWQGGPNGYYEIHTHTPDLSEFTEHGWNQCYCRIAQMLRKNPHVKGIVGGSWFYDPALKDISPRLMYLQKIPLDNGARCFFVGEDTSGNAIHKSETRLKLYQQGKYVPKSHLLIWPRKAMIKWSEDYLSEKAVDFNLPGVI